MRSPRRARRRGQAPPYKGRRSAGALLKPRNTLVARGDDAHRCAGAASWRSARRSALSSAARPPRRREQRRWTRRRLVIVADAACRTSRTTGRRSAARPATPRARSAGSRARADIASRMRSASESWSTAGSVARRHHRRIVRGVARLLAEVSEFMTLAPGDVLLLGVAGRRAACARRPAVGSRSTGSAARNRSPPGAPHEARPRRLRRGDPRRHPGRRRRALRLADGRELAEDEVVWLPPFEPGTIIALGLNYADHAKELAFTRRTSRWCS